MSKDKNINRVFYITGNINSYDEPYFHLEQPFNTEQEALDDNLEESDDEEFYMYEVKVIKKYKRVIKLEEVLNV